MGGDNVLLYGLEREDSLDSTSGAEEVTRHRLRRADIQLIGSVTEDFLNSLGLGDIPDRRRSPVYVDVVNIFRGEPCILECISHHQLSTQPIRVSSREVVSTQPRGQYLRAQRRCVHHERWRARAPRRRGKQHLRP